MGKCNTAPYNNQKTTQNIGLMTTFKKYANKISIYNQNNIKKSIIKLLNNSQNNLVEHNRCKRVFYNGNYRN